MKEAAPGSVRLARCMARRYRGGPLDGCMAQHEGQLPMVAEDQKRLRRPSREPNPHTPSRACTRRRDGRSRALD
eukprot:scaffold9488_cov27-Tisochrysis_lutea.AAC.1